MNHALMHDLDNYMKQKRYRLINSVLLYKDGELVVERYYNKFDEKSRNNIKSIWKSIISICIGICLDKGFLNCITDPISRYIPEFNRNSHPYHKLITVKHLLTMTSGIYWNGGIHYHCPMHEQFIRSKNQLEYLSDIQMADLPGTKNIYKEWDVILLSAVIASVSGMNTYDFCDKYLYRPMGISSGRWWTSSSGLTYNIANNEIEQAKSDLSAKDLAKLGILFLNKGVYNNEQIVSGEYVRQATSPSDCNAGYGFMWLLFDGGFGCRGFGGQEVNVLPNENIVYVIQAKPTPSSKSYGDVFVELLKTI